MCWIDMCKCITGKQVFILLEYFTDENCVGLTYS